MPALVRTAGPRGAHFWDEEDKTMFLLQLDGSTRFGPREATAEDIDAHPAAYERFLKGQEPEINPAPVRAADPPGGRPAPRQYRRRGEQ